jgi:selenide, water dikinase
VPAGLLSNREFAECMVVDDDGARIDETARTLLYDPQTSGGLLISMPPIYADKLVHELREAGYPAAHIGQVLEGEPRIVLR